MLTTLDYSVIAIYFVGVIAFGIWSGGRQGNSKDYFLGGKDLPWWAICFSIVATETSTLTVIGIPAVSYGGALTFIQLTLGYLVGRILVSFILLPKYFEGEFQTAYAFLGDRFGGATRKTASVTFLFTRLLADGVRLFATAIPIKLIAEAAGYSLSYMAIIAIIGVLTIIYTMIGGIKAVVWMDVVQMTVYVGGACFAILVLLADAPAGWWQMAQDAGKTTVIDLEMGRPLSYLLTHPYAFFTAVFGGAIFTMASHGSDQLIVQRLLACKDLKDSKRALIGSGVLVIIQFVIFLAVGLLLWVHFDGASMEALGLTRADEVFPRFIIEGLPSGLSGLILAGIIAAAMSTLSSSLNALSSSTVLDLYAEMRIKKMDAATSLKVARIFTLIWGIVFILFAGLFEDQKNPVVELGLAIATFTYGGMLGLFVLGLFVKKAKQFDAIVGFCVAIVLMALIIKGVRYGETNGWQFILNLNGDAGQSTSGLLSVAWPLYTFIGAAITVGVGGLLSLRKS
ncbi:MAG: sodium:solute symporter [Rhodothermales bacterium]